MIPRYSEWVQNIKIMQRICWIAASDDTDPDGASHNVFVMQVLKDKFEALNWSFGLKCLLISFAPLLMFVAHYYGLLLHHCVLTQFR